MTFNPEPPAQYPPTYPPEYYPVASQYPYYPPNPGMPTPTPRKRWIAWLAALVILVGAGMVTAAVLVNHSHSVSKFTVSGSFDLYDNETESVDGTDDEYSLSPGIIHNGTQCNGESGYEDLGEGTQITVDVDAKVVAYGEFSDGVYSGGDCSFTFDITGVPAGKARYGVTVTHRGTQYFTETEMRGGISLNVGG